MKALVLAGGTGSRLRPFSYSTPKQLVPVAGEPVLFHGLRSLKDIGVTEVGIVVSGHGTAIRSAVGNGSAFGMAITYIEQDLPRGLAHCIVIARDFLGDEDFVMLLGDNVFADGFGAAKEAFMESRPAALLTLVKVPNPVEYGVAVLDSSGRVVDLEEKPTRPRSDLAVTGVYFSTSQIHQAVDSVKPSWRNELEITDALKWLVVNGHQVLAHEYPGYWKDTGNVVDMLECNRALLDNIAPSVRGSVDALSQIGSEVLIEPGAVVVASRIDGPAIIGRGSQIRDSYVGPYTSVGAGCLVENASVEDSILLDRSSMCGVRSVRGSLIGAGADVRLGNQELRVHRLIIGDDSMVEMPV